MMAVLRTLLSPLNYLRATNKYKFVWDWLIPLFLAGVATSCIFILPRPISILADKGLVHWVNELLQVLVGFYIAALAAIASFDRASLDQLIEGGGAVLKVLRDGKKVSRSLSRRIFLSLMFGYLSFLSILLYCFGLAVNLLIDNIHCLPERMQFYGRGAFCFVYLFMFIQMLVITLVAIFYLSDRIHRQTPMPLPSRDVDNN